MNLFLIKFICSGRGVIIGGLGLARAGVSVGRSGLMVLFRRFLAGFCVGLLNKKDFGCRLQAASCPYGLGA